MVVTGNDSVLINIYIFLCGIRFENAAVKIILPTVLEKTIFSYETNKIFSTGLQQGRFNLFALRKVVYEIVCVTFAFLTGCENSRS